MAGTAERDILEQAGFFTAESAEQIMTEKPRRDLTEGAAAERAECAKTEEAERAMMKEAAAEEAERVIMEEAEFFAAEEAGLTLSEPAMTEKALSTPYGSIHYWTNADSPAWAHVDELPTLVLLPGLTADHRLFDKQVEYFASRYPLITWDAPGHAASRPFRLEFELADKARWVHEILEAEGVRRFVLIGQSMGAYVGQAFLQEFPGQAAGFISIDSAPLQRSYYSGWELWLLERMEPCYRWYPHSWLVSQGSAGNSETEYGQALMTAFIADYEHREYAALAGHGFHILAAAAKKELPYSIDVPALLMCGEHDKAGSTKSYNKKWAACSGIPIAWVPNAGHNSNTDNPAFVNEQIQQFLDALE